MRSLLLCSMARIKSLPGLRPSVLATDSAVSLSKPLPHRRSCFISQFCGLADAGIKNSARLDLIIRFSQESASAQVRSRFSSCFNAEVRFRSCRRSWLVAQRSWQSLASCFSAIHHRGNDFSALHLQSSVCFCCASRNQFCVHRVSNFTPISQLWHLVLSPEVSL
jgi:hypothetical protein